MNNAYDRRFRDHALQVAKDLGFIDIVREGVYAMCGGPMYETVAELLFLRNTGIDAVGMSTVPEVTLILRNSFTVYVLLFHHKLSLSNIKEWKSF